MSKIEKMSVLGVRSFGTEDKDKQVISFFSPLTVLVGTNGAGKTTIIECLKYICTGDFPPGTKGTAFVHDPKVAHETDVRAQIRLQFRDVTGAIVAVQRSLQATQKAKKVEFKTLEGLITRIKNGEKVSISSKCAEIDREMISALGVSKSVLSNVIFCHQEDSNWPLSEGKALKQKFDEIFSATRYIKALEVLRKLRMEQAASVKQYQSEIKYLRQNKDKAEEIGKQLLEAEDKLTASKSNVDSINRDMQPIEDKLNELDQKLEGVIALDREIKAIESRKKQMEEDLRELEEKIEQVFQGSDDQLLSEYKNHRQGIQQKEWQLEARLHDLQQADGELQQLGVLCGELLLKQGKLQEEWERHKRTIGQRDQLIQELATQLGLEGFSATPFTGRQVQSFLHLLQERQNQDAENAGQVLSDFQAKEEAKQRQVDELRGKKTSLEGVMSVKKLDLARKESEVIATQSELSRLQSSQDRLHEVERQLSEAERQLAVASEGLIGDRLAEQVIELQKQHTVQDRSLRILDQEMAILNEETQARTQIDMLRRDKNEKEEQIRRVRARHQEVLFTIIGHFPTRRELEDWLQTRRIEISDLQIKIQDLNKKLASAEQNKSHLSVDLRRKEEQVQEYQEQLFEACSGQDFESAMSALCDQIEHMSKQRSMLAGASAVYQQFIGQLTGEGGGEEGSAHSSSCPICQRTFPSDSDLQEVVEDLRGRLRLVPEKLRATETKLKQRERNRDQMLELKPIRQNLSRLQDQEVPSTRNRLQECGREIVRLNACLEDEETVMAILSSEESSIKACQQDVVLMDRFQADVKELEQRATQQEANLSGSNLDRSLQQVGQEKKQAQLKFDDLNSSLESKRKAIQQETKRLQELKEKVQHAYGEKLQLVAKTQRLQQMRDVEGRLREEVASLAKDMQEAEEKVFPLVKRIQTLIQEKVEITGRKQRQQAQAVQEMNTVKDKRKDITTLLREVESYENSRKDEHRKQKEREMDRLRQEQAKGEVRRKEIECNITTIRQDIDTQQLRERSLQDNLTLRRRQQELTTVGEKRKCLVVKMGHMNVNQIKTEQQGLVEKLENLKQRRNCAQGRQHGFQEEIQRCNKELRDPQFHNAAESFRRMMIKSRITELANKDLDIYYKALDQAIMKFHSMKMEEINKIIRDLWRTIYRGQDIEYIEICSDADEGFLTSDKRRTYNYRVVRVQADTRLDMRCHCSAGQKVLASLIIRLALAETFCLNCGILALDEPTTNLDRENIESLALALVEIIKSRSQQSNFQLLVITHDEDFVELLGRSDYVDQFYRVRKNLEQNSEIIKCNITSLHPCPMIN
uniref:DNA repair protein RAD50 isoform X1 n=2 Tax=Myxine glutinosa TaxID=7769 RepID=UPI00358F3D7A